MPDCELGDPLQEICDLKSAVAELTSAVGHPPMTVTFGAGANAFDATLQTLNINVPVIPPTPDPEVVVVADAAARAALAPTKLNSLLIQTTDATNGSYSVWSATGLTAGSWQLKTGSMSPQNASNVAITGGSITGIVDLAKADGGTGASNSAGARINLRCGVNGGTGSGDIDWALGDNFTYVINANAVFTMSNILNSLSIMVAVASTGAFTVDFPAGILWPGGSMPAHSGTGKTDVYAFTCIDSVIYASVVQDYPT